jgi:hypothetical protein
MDFYNSTALFSGPFKPNTRYTILICTESFSNRACPFRVKYTDNSYSYIGNNSSTTTKTKYRTVTDAGKTVSAIVGLYDSNPFYIYYEECGIFESSSVN